MNVILFNLYDIPSYLKTCVKQIQHFNPDATIHLITDKNIQTTGNIKCYNVQQFGITYGLSQKVKFFKDNNVKEHRELFLSSALRFLYIYELSRHLKLDNIFTFDNDVLIYGDLKKIAYSIPWSTNIAITQSVKNEFICGFSYFRNYKDLTEIAGDMESFLQYSQSQLKDIFGNAFTGDFISEMSLLYFINQVRNLNALILPSLPKDSLDGETVFDSISYGHVLGGVSPKNGGNGTPFIDKNHITANDIETNKVRVIFDQEQKKPFVLDEQGKKFNLFNLHVHSKNLELFKSF